MKKEFKIIRNQVSCNAFVLFDDLYDITFDGLCRFLRRDRE